MQNILLSHSYFLRLDPKQWETGRPYAPLGTLYAAAWLRENGFRVSLYDSMFAPGPQDFGAELDKTGAGTFVLYDDGFNYLTKMCLTNMREAAFAMIRQARDRGCQVWVSSSDSSDHVEEYLDQGADFVLLGEGEMTLLELAIALRDGTRQWGQIAGLAFREEGKTTRTSPRAVLRHLDQLPLPAWDLLDIQPYRQSWMRHAGYFSLNLATTRGCPYKCNWCAKPIYGNRYNSRSPLEVVREIQVLQNSFDFQHIWFCDDIFGLKPGWVAEFADLLEKKCMSIRFKIQARADLLASESYVRDLARAGCESVWMGAESGSQKILDAMDKGIRVDQIRQATQLLRKHGIAPCFFIQFGYPGETMDDIRQTISLVNELLPLQIGVSVSYPLPGTLFYEKVKAELGNKSNWTHSDELALMFRNTYRPAFYKRLHRYLHRTHRKHLALDRTRLLWKNPAAATGSMVRKALSLLYYIPASFFSGLFLRATPKITS
jgi:anaerobic magnesium-protoporphyrin IX monomethyl ester cyclase